MTLVEFMIAITIGMALVLLVSTLYAGTSKTTRLNDNLGRMNSDARVAMDELARSLRQAGYMGCLQPGGITRNRINSSAYDYNFGASLRGHTGTGSAFSPVLPTGSPVPAAADRNSDVLVVRGGLGALPLISPFPTVSTANIVVGLPTNHVTVATGDAAVVTDCGSATMFQATNVAASGGGLSIAHATSGTPGNTAADLGRAFFGGSEVVPLQTVTYYIAPGASGRNALWRAIGSAAPEEVVAGVQRMRAVFGVDNTSDRAVDTWYSAQDLESCGAACIARWGRTAAVQLHLLMESNEDNVASAPTPYVYMGATVTPTNSRLHRIYTATVNVRNRVP